MRWVAVLGIAGLLAGCGGGNGPTNRQGLVGGLRGEGIDPQSPQPEPPGVLEVPSTVYTVPGGVLHVFTFSDDPAAKEAQARVQPDGYMVRNTTGINQAIDWAAPPHWFRKGKEIAAYIGTSSEVTDALSEVAGPQFAGA
jgi:hypothetical protein